MIIFALPPNTTHLSQPLDKGCFGPLKSHWREVCHRFISENPGKVVTRYSFSNLLRQAWMSSMTMKNVIAGFKTTGIYPVDRNAVIKKVEYDHTSVSETTLPFLPMTSPMPRKKNWCRPPISSSQPTSCTFTSAETALFERRYENQYDLTTDKQYNRWLSLNHPDNPLNPILSQQPDEDDSLNPFPSQQSDPLEEVHMPAQVANTRSTLSKLLSFEKSPQRPQPPKGHAFVATRSEKIAELQAKKKKRDEDVLKKLRAKEEREIDKENAKKQKQELAVQKRKTKTASASLLGSMYMHVCFHW